MKIYNSLNPEETLSAKLEEAKDNTQSTNALPHWIRIYQATEKLKKAVEEHPNFSTEVKGILEALEQEKKYIPQEKSYLVAEFINLTADGVNDPNKLNVVKYQSIIVDLAKEVHTHRKEPGTIKLAAAGLVFLGVVIVAASITVAIMSFGGSTPASLAFINFGIGLALKGLAILSGALGLTAGLGIAAGMSGVALGTSKRPVQIQTRGIQFFNAVKAKNQTNLPDSKLDKNRKQKQS